VTTQVRDIVNYRDSQYAIAGMVGVGLFRPDDHGLVAHEYSTAHGRGYECEYTVDCETLFLDQLNIGLSVEDTVNGVRIFGHVLVPYAPGFRQLREGTRGPFISYARDMHHPVLFSGGLLLGAEFGGGLYVHMGFHPAEGYRVIHELIFEGGKLCKASDRTLDLASLRESIARTPGYSSSKQVTKESQLRIKNVFSFDYMHAYA
jgi:hypothetical protein